jgi:hypothetical protein
MYYVLVELLTYLTPDILAAIALLVGAFVTGATIMAGMVYLCRYFGWLF